MKQRPPRRVRRSSRTMQAGQVMILFALLLPVVVGFLALSMAASIEMDTKAALDQASLTAAVSASSDACMSSNVSFDIYECKSGGTQPLYAGGGLEDPTTRALAPPPYTGGPPFPLTANNATCSIGGKCVLAEHDIAVQAADYVVNETLYRDYPNFTLEDCTSGLGAVPLAHGSRVASCASPTTSTTLVYDVEVSYWYYLDTDDVQGINPFLPAQDHESQDAIELQASSIPNSCSDGPNNTGNLNTVDGNYGEVCPQHSGPNDADNLPHQPAGQGVNPHVMDNPTNLVCPVSGNFARLVQVTMSTQFLNPFGGILGIGQVALTTNSQSYGCTG